MSVYWHGTIASGQSPSTSTCVAICHKELSPSHFFGKLTGLLKACYTQQRFLESGEAVWLLCRYKHLPPSEIFSVFQPLWCPSPPKINRFWSWSQKNLNLLPMSVYWHGTIASGQSPSTSTCIAICHKELSQSHLQPLWCPSPAKINQFWSWSRKNL